MNRRDFITLLSGPAFLCSVVCCCFMPLSAQAIDCLSAPDHSESGWWSWREIDGRKCWFKKVGAVPPKSVFRWPEHAEEAPLTETAQRSQPNEAIAATSPQVEVVRVKPVETRDRNYRLGDGRVGLLDGFDLSGRRGIGGIWEMPASIKLGTDTFDARYGEWSDH